jgi:hypothetical protein
MRQLRITHNAAFGYQRRLAPDQSISGAYYQLKRACAGGRYEQRPPEWLRKARGQADGYMVLDGEVAALPVRDRVIACLLPPDKCRGLKRPRLVGRGRVRLIHGFARLVGWRRVFQPARMARVSRS